MGWFAPRDVTVREGDGGAAIELMKGGGSRVAAAVIALAGLSLGVAGCAAPESVADEAVIATPDSTSAATIESEPVAAPALPWETIPTDSASIVACSVTAPYGQGVLSVEVYSLETLELIESWTAPALPAEATAVTSTGEVLDVSLGGPHWALVDTCASVAWTPQFDRYPVPAWIQGLGSLPAAVSAETGLVEFLVDPPTESGFSAQSPEVVLGAMATAPDGTIWWSGSDPDGQWIFGSEAGDLVEVPSSALDQVGEGYEFVIAENGQPEFFSDWDDAETGGWYVSPPDWIKVDAIDGLGQQRPWRAARQVTNGNVQAVVPVTNWSVWGGIEAADGSIYFLGQAPESAEVHLMQAQGPDADPRDIGVLPLRDGNYVLLEVGIFGR